MSKPLRRRARELVLQALYAAEFGEAEPEQCLNRLLESEPLAESQVDFAQMLFQAVLRRSGWADDQIARLAKNWDIRRFAAIDRVILRMGVVEIEEIPETPVKVVLNEAIELAKKYSTGESSAFVNGILDSFVKQRRSTADQ